MDAGMLAQLSVTTATFGTAFSSNDFVVFTRIIILSVGKRSKENKVWLINVDRELSPSEVEQILDSRGNIQKRGEPPVEPAP